MKVALPVWGQRLSPVLDFAHRLLVVDIKKGAVTRRKYHLMDPRLPSFSQAAVLAELGVSVLICGSISLDLVNMIRPAGIRIIPSISGRVEEIVQAYLNDSLSDPRFRMPGAHAGDGGFFGKDIPPGE